MTSRKNTALFLAATLFISGASGALLGSATPAHAITSVDELTDVNRDHWAFDALRDLVEKYDVIEGYPDYTFRGNRMPTRWEMAAALNSLIKSIGRDLARLGAEKADKTDLQTLARLQEEFKQELAALNARVNALESRAAAIEAKNEEQDNRLSLLEKTQIHGDMSFGLLQDIGNNGVSDARSGTPDGIADGLSAIARLRLTLDVPVVEETEDSWYGDGYVHARIISAFGRVAPQFQQSGNKGGFNGFSGYSRIAGDSSAFNEGYLNGTAAGANNNGSTRPNLYLENVHYRQHFKSGIPFVSEWVPSDNPDWQMTGDLYAGLIPWRYLFDKSPYRGDELDQFQNTAFVNTPGLAVNHNMAMIAHHWNQGLGEYANMDLTAGVGSINYGDVYDGFALTYEGRLNYNTGFISDDWAMPGSFYAGGYHIWNFGNGGLARNGFTTGWNRSGGTSSVGGVVDLVALDTTPRGSTNAFYLGWNQEWWRGIGTTINYFLSGNSNSSLAYTSSQQWLGLNTATTANRQVAGGNPVLAAARQSLSTVLHVPVKSILPGWRDKDAIGLGYAFIDLYENDLIQNGTWDDAMEHVFEAYYKLQVNDNISVVPSMQLMFNRLGLDANDVTTILGVRTNFKF